MKSDTTFSVLQKTVLLVLIILVILIEFVDFSSFGYAKDIDMITNTMLRIVAGTIFIIVLTGLGHGWLFRMKHVGKALIIMIPAFIIAINNFPISAYFNNRTQLVDPVYRVFLFLIECLSVGFFEEILFRGVILIFLVQKLAQRKHGIFISVILSSVFFGLSHIINLFNGASLPDTLLQIGYSSLMGMLWAVMFLRTGNLWLTMLLHATYNFFGQVMFYLGRVDNRYDNITVISTVVIAVLVLLYAYKQLTYAIKRPIVMFEK